MAEKILVVEDESDIRKLITYHLLQERFRILEAENGEDALELVSREKPRLIILDLMLPGLSGLEFCKIIRQQAATAHIPILMLTAKAGEADRVVGLEMGADDYITKPFSPREMIARVKAVLRRTEAAAISPKDEIYQKGEVGKVPLKQVHTVTTKEEGATILVFRVHELGQPGRVLVD